MHINTDLLTNPWMLAMAIISVPKPLREKLGEEGSDALIELLNRQTESEKGDIIQLVEEKFERRLSEEMAKVNERISAVQANLIKWMFLFWIGQVGAILGILFAFFR